MKLCDGDRFCRLFRCCRRLLSVSFCWRHVYNSLTFCGYSYLLKKKITIKYITGDFSLLFNQRRLRQTPANQNLVFFLVFDIVDGFGRFHSCHVACML